MGVILPKDMLEKMNVTEGDVLHALESEDKKFSLMIEDAMFAEQMRIAREGMERYKNTLQKLAE